MWRNTRVAWVVAVAVLGTSMPAMATEIPGAAMWRPKKKARSSRGPKKPSDAVAPADAAAKRAPAQARGQALVAQGQFGAAGIEFDNAASELGDPVLYIDGGEAYLAGARKDRDVDLANAGAERGRIALDILYFHLDAGADPYFRLVETSDIPALIVRAQKLIEDAEALVEEIEAEAVATTEPEEKKKKRKRGKVDREQALLISGAVFTAVGIGFLGLGGAGLGLGIKHQMDAEHPTVYGDDYDAVAAKGQKANMMAYVGLPVGGALLATGIALLVVSTRGKKKKPEEEQVAVTPSFGRNSTGVAISGRF